MHLTFLLKLQTFFPTKHNIITKYVHVDDFTTGYNSHCRINLSEQIFPRIITFVFVFHKNDDFFSFFHLSL